MVSQRASPKLKRALESLIAAYGAEQVKDALDKCEPFVTRNREDMASIGKYLRQKHARRNMYLRSRENLLKHTVIRLSVYHSSDDDHFTVWTHTQAKDGRYIEYKEPRSKFDDFVAWLKRNGFDDDLEPSFMGEQDDISKFVHVERDQEQRMRRERFEPDTVYVPLKWFG